MQHQLIIFSPIAAHVDVVCCMILLRESSKNSAVFFLKHHLQPTQRAEPQQLALLKEPQSVSATSFIHAKHLSQKCIPASSRTMHPPSIGSPVLSDNQLL